jgi:medium-chain acyl-[acyl-carrier-protein] hydrolase
MLEKITSGNPVRIMRRSPRATTRLVCFPPAGAGPSLFNDWASLLPPSIELVGVVYPGRECRSTEPLSRSLETIADSTAEHIAGLAEMPSAFFGHSMGGYVSFEVVQRLAGSAAHPDHLFLSATPAPHTPVPEQLHGLNESRFFRELLRLDGFPQEVLNTPDLVRHALPILRADFTACETHRFSIDAFCRCPLSVFGGNSDIRVTHDRLESWRHFAGLSFSLRLFDGGHFYLRKQRAELVSLICSELARMN